MKVSGMRNEKKAAKSFGRRLRQLRQERGWSQEELSTRADISKNYIGEIERGENNVSIHYIARLAAALSITIGELFQGL
jgi:transcriptional regulator with XRE-family HTH domain